MAIEVVKEGAWVPGDGEAKAVAWSTALYKASQANVGYNPNSEGATGWGASGALLTGMTVVEGQNLGTQDITLSTNPGIWLVQASCEWIALAEEQLLMRCRQSGGDGLYGQASSFVPNNGAPTIKTAVTLCCMVNVPGGGPPLDQVRFEVCTKAGSAQTVTNINVRCHFLSGQYAT